MTGLLRHILIVCIGWFLFNIEAFNTFKSQAGRAEFQISAGGVDLEPGEDDGTPVDTSLPQPKLLQFIINLLEGQKGQKHRSIILSGMHSHIDSEEGQHLLKLEEERTKNRWNVLKDKDGRSYFSNGPNTPMIPYEMYKSHRDRFAKRIKERIEESIGNARVGVRLGSPRKLGGASSLNPNEEYNLFLFEGGKLQSIYGTDVDSVFRQEPNFLWLFGVREPNVKAAIDVKAGKSYLFVPYNGDDFKLMSGTNATGPDGLQWWTEKYEVDYVHQEREMEKVIMDLMKKYEEESIGGNRPEQVVLADKIHTKELNKSDLTKLAASGGPFKLKINPSDIVSRTIGGLRSVKDDWELQIMQYVNDVTSEGHIAAMQQSALATKHPGIASMEWAAEAVFRYIAMMRGCLEVQYEASCGGGSNAAFMHYSMDQWEPNSELVHPGEFRMLDLSAAYAGYTADVASSYPENGQFSKQQKLLYDAILDAQEQAEEILAPGITWAQLYSVAEKALLTHMKAAGILKGDIEKMVEARLLGSVFMPHLLGHQLGMDPHDPDTGDGGYEPLEAGNVVTIEPSLYFQPSLLADLESNSLLKAFVDMEKLEEFRPVGGMRSEDNLVVTDTGCRKLTRVPRRTEDIEAIMSEEMVWKPWEKTIQVYPTKGLKSCTCQRNLFSTTVLLLASIFFYYSH